MNYTLYSDGILLYSFVLGMLPQVIYAVDGTIYHPHLLLVRLLIYI